MTTTDDVTAQLAVEAERLAATQELYAGRPETPSATAPMPQAVWS